MEQPNHSDREYTVADQMDQPSPKNMLCGLVFAILTFLLVVICALSIQIIKQEADDIPPLPSHEQNDPETPPLVDPNKQPSQNPGTTDPTTPSDPVPGGDNPPATQSFVMKKTASTKVMEKCEGDVTVGIYSSNAVMIDLSDHTIVAQYKADEVIYPASLTKIMTLLIACENLEESDYNEYVTISAAIAAEMDRQEASGIQTAGLPGKGKLQPGEELTVRDLMYLVGMESDGFAACQLAEYVAGSQEAFVRMMNAKCAELDLMSTHFANPTGLHDDNHYSTCREMASIMAAALANGNVAKYLSDEQYRVTTNLRSQYVQSTFFHDMKVAITQWFPLPDGVKVVAAKTGLTPEAGYCLASSVASISGKKYIIVTVGGSNEETRCVDLKYIYETYANQQFFDQ